MVPHQSQVFDNLSAHWLAFEEQKSGSAPAGTDAPNRLFMQDVRLFFSLLFCLLTLPYLRSSRPKYNALNINYLLFSCTLWRRQKKVHVILRLLVMVSTWGWYSEVKYEGKGWMSSLSIKQKIWGRCQDRALLEQRCDQAIDKIIPYGHDV